MKVSALLTVLIVLLMLGGIVYFFHQKNTSPKYSGSSEKITIAVAGIQQPSLVWIAKEKDYFKERTKQLDEKMIELERTNKSMVGRELKMTELKKEIADLKKEGGE